LWSIAKQFIGKVINNFSVLNNEFIFANKINIKLHKKKDLSKMTAPAVLCEPLSVLQVNIFCLKIYKTARTNFQGSNDKLYTQY
jgi:hypothetical protein